MIGSLEEAVQASDGELLQIGDGSTRRVYLSGDGSVVYKVEHFDDGTNQHEYHNITKLLASPVPNIRVPKATLYFTHFGAVLACEYVDGQPESACDHISSDSPCPMECRWRNLLYKEIPGFTDWGGENVIFDGDDIWLIDLGE